MSKLTNYNFLFSLQLAVNILLLACSNIIGYYYVQMTAATHRRTLKRTKGCVESRQGLPTSYIMVTYNIQFIS